MNNHCMIHVANGTVIAANFEETTYEGSSCYYHIQLMPMTGSWMTPGDPLPQSTFKEGISNAQPPITAQFKQSLAITFHMSDTIWSQAFGPRLSIGAYSPIKVSQQDEFLRPGYVAQFAFEFIVK